jgi:hypothetical protein
MCIKPPLSLYHIPSIPYTIYPIERDHDAYMCIKPIYYTHICIKPIYYITHVVLNPHNVERDRDAQAAGQRAEREERHALLKPHIRTQAIPGMFDIVIKPSYYTIYVY